MTDDQDRIARLIEESSLGAPPAASLRRRIPRDAAQAAVQAAFGRDGTPPPAEGDTEQAGRLANDARWVTAARSGGPGSFVYRTLADTLREMAIGHLVTRDEQHKLFADLRRMGLNLPAPPAGWAEESRSVIHVSVMTALRRFMQRQVMDGGWDATRGTSLQTYFINACKYSFAQEYRKYHRAESVDSATARDTIASALPSDLDARLRYMFSATAEGRSQAEIAEHLGMTPEAVSATMRRYRRRVGDSREHR